VLTALARQSYEDDIASDDIAGIALDSRVARNHVSETLATLQRLGLIERQPKARGRGWRVVFVPPGDGAQVVPLHAPANPDPRGENSQNGTTKLPDRDASSPKTGHPKTPDRDTLPLGDTRGLDTYKTLRNRFLASSSSRQYLEDDDDDRPVPDEKAVTDRAAAFAGWYFDEALKRGLHGGHVSKELFVQADLPATIDLLRSNPQSLARRRGINMLESIVVGAIHQREATVRKLRDRWDWGPVVYGPTARRPSASNSAPVEPVQMVSGSEVLRQQQAKGRAW
jgi:hypothetical protein